MIKNKELRVDCYVESDRFDWSRDYDWQKKNCNGYSLIFFCRRV
jgi:hypothetical protein